MEDIFSVAYQQTDDEKDLEYAFFGIFDGHGGREAAQFAKVRDFAQFIFKVFLFKGRSALHCTLTSMFESHVLARTQNRRVN
jgi:serine/threonine protein phosphatase PrpC